MFLPRCIREALDNRSPVEAVPCSNWELHALTGAAEGFSRASLAGLEPLQQDRIHLLWRLIMGTVA